MSRWSDSRGALWISGWNSGDVFRRLAAVSFNRPRRIASGALRALSGMLQGPTCGASVTLGSREIVRLHIVAAGELAHRHALLVAAANRLAFLEQVLFLATVAIDGLLIRLRGLAAESTGNATCRA
jgi:hypothetical protein